MCYIRDLKCQTFIHEIRQFYCCFVGQYSGSLLLSAGCGVWRWPVDHTFDQCRGIPDLLFLRIEAELFGNQVRTAQLEIAPCCTKRYFRAVSVDFIAFSSVFSKCGARTLLVVIFFLAALPSTVSSSVVMVSIARGNVPAAIFNASISGLIGVVVTPLWMGLFLDFHTDHVFADVYWGLIREIILPVILGLWLQRYFGMWANRHSKSLSLFDKTVILLIVYSSFAESFTSGVFEEVSRVYLVWVLVGVVVFFAVVYVLLWMLVKYVFRFTLADQITAIFCGSKKSLTHGSVFGKFLFVNNPLAGLYFLPIMLFHAFQIFVVTIIAQYYHTKEGLKE